MPVVHSKIHLPLPTASGLERLALCDCGDIVHPWHRGHLIGSLICSANVLERSLPLYTTLQLLRCDRGGAG